MLCQADFCYVILWHLNYRWAKIQFDNFLFHIKAIFWLFLPAYLELYLKKVYVTQIIRELVFKIFWKNI